MSTAATKTMTREEELQATLEPLRARLAEYGTVLDAQEGRAAAIAAELEALNGDLDTPIEALAERRRTLEKEAKDLEVVTRAIAHRINAFSTENGITEMEAELAVLVRARTEAATLAAMQSQADAWYAELERMPERVVAHKLEGAALDGKHQEVWEALDRLAATPGVRVPPRMHLSPRAAHEKANNAIADAARLGTRVPLPAERQ